MSKKGCRSLVVNASEQLTQHMQRIVLTGDDLSDFPLDRVGGYVKLLFSQDGQAIIDSTMLGQQKPLMRTYTIRAFNSDQRTLTIDFVLHHDEAGGPASTWAANAKIGDRICIAGPGPAKYVRSDVDSVLFLGDMTALPAIACNLERLPSDAKGQVVIEIPSREDEQILEVPEGVTIQWLVTHADDAEPVLLSALKAMDRPQGDLGIWAACEFSRMRAIRQYLKEVWHIERKSMYISSYWKANSSEDEHKIIKQQDQARMDNTPGLLSKIKALINSVFN